MNRAVYVGGQVRTHEAPAVRTELRERVVRLSTETVLAVKGSTTRRDTLLTTLSLETGRVWVNRTTDQPHEFTVETSGAVAVVRDTRFGVRLSNGETLVSVAVGEVELTAQKQVVTVSAGQQSVVAPGQPPPAPWRMTEASPWREPVHLIPLGKRLRS